MIEPLFSRIDLSMELTPFLTLTILFLTVSVILQGIFNDKE